MVLRTQNGNDTSHHQRLSITAIAILILARAWLYNNSMARGCHQFARGPLGLVLPSVRS